MASRWLLGACLLALAAPAPATAGTSDALEAILAFDPARVETLAGLDAALLEPGEIRVAGLRPQLGSTNVRRRWAAAYVGHAVADDPGDLSALRPRLRDADPSVRALAAFGLAGFGEKDGLGELAALASSRELMAHSDGQPLAVLAEERLELLTRTRVGNWRRWWSRVRSTIRWDRGAQRYRWRGAQNARTTAAPAAPAAAPAAAAAAPVAVAAAGTVTIPIKVQIDWGPGVTSAQKSAILRNIRKAVDVLNGDGRTGRCSPLEFELELVVGGELRPDPFFSIVVHEIPKLNGARWSTSWVNVGRRTGRFWSSQVAGDKGHLVIAHEFGHISGLPDEYYEHVAGQRVITSPVDPDSFMGDDYKGRVLQRHLDYLSRRHDPAGDAGCERWVLRFGNWTSRLDAWTDDTGSSATNWLGFTAVARIAVHFWAGADGAILPAGAPVCGGEVTPGRTPANPNARTSRCPDAGGNSEGLSAHAVEGQADCGSPPPRLQFASPRFDTTVRGSRQGDNFRLRLAVGDAQQAEAIHCDPPAEPSITQRYNLISDGMDFAGALNFSMTPPSAQFRRDGDHKHASGNATLTRLEPPA